ncbi:MAG: LysR family transcriptional regulator substrate-binding protein [Myxococcota bacterium]
MITRTHLLDFLEIADRRSIQAAAKATGRSRATLMRHLTELQEALSAPELLERAPGMREGVLTPEGEVLRRRARLILRHWAQWELSTKDAIAAGTPRLRLGAIAGSFDLLLGVLDELRAAEPEVVLKVIEYPGEELVDRVIGGEVDLGFGTLARGASARGAAFIALGTLDYVLIAPPRLIGKGGPASLADLDGVPMVVPRQGALREEIERRFLEHDRGPLYLNAVAEVESTPRLVELVARGFGVGLVSRLRLSFLPSGLVVRALSDGPSALRAGIFIRRGVEPSALEQALITRARARFLELMRPRRART